MLNIEVKEDNRQKVLNEFDDAIERALTAIGLQASAYAADRCPVDTGLLRNSMTYAVSGKNPAQSTYRADRPNKQGVVKSGNYTNAWGSSGEKAVYIGSNVEYAQYQELGTHGRAGRHMIRDAAQNHVNEYKQMLRFFLEG